MELDRFKAAIARLFFDMINADGVIEDDEILLLEGLGDYEPPKDKTGRPIRHPGFTPEANDLILAGGLRKKYRLSVNIIQDSLSLTTAEAISIIKEWQGKDEERQKRLDPKTVFLTANIVEDLKIISGCDGNRSIEEAKLLAAISLCVNTGARSNIRAIPISYRERNLRFAKKEIVYLESKYNEAVNGDIKKNKAYLSALLNTFGYDFVYIPDVINFLKKKASEKLLAPILMFTTPFYYTDSDAVKDFVRNLQDITTEEFTGTFTAASTIRESLPPCFLIKLKSSIVEECLSDGLSKKVKYTDFIAIPIENSVVDAARRFPENVLEHTDAIVSLLTKSLQEKLYSKGIHKTLIDYAIHKSSANILNQIVIDRRRNLVIFEGIDGGKLKMSKKELAFFLLFALYSSNRKGLNRRLSRSSAAGQTLTKIYDMIYKPEKSDEKGVFESLTTYKNRIRKYISSLVKFDERERYNVPDRGDTIIMVFNPDIIKIQDYECNNPIPLLEWMKMKGINKMIN